MEEAELLYLSGKSCQQIKDELGLNVTVRTLQRRLAKSGVIRSASDAFRLAVKQGRVTYHTSPNKTARKRLSDAIKQDVLYRDGHKCRLCGSTAKDDRLQVDHVDGDKNNNVFDNLQVLCEPCNKAKYYRRDKNRGNTSGGEAAN